MISARQTYGNLVTLGFISLTAVYPKSLSNHPLVRMAALQLSIPNKAFFSLNLTDSFGLRGIPLHDL
ncbi:hypothetical protein OMCYN_01616 [cyanobiont of Ornithocercus magnificus]|nr:hypothetical protein OMCYN_01616 [cyanobiont of Ornithocercus magnificus]